MALEIRQSLKMSLQPIMTPQLQQAIKLLQLSRMELMDLIRQEEEENPVLEQVSEPTQEAEPLETSYETISTSPAESQEKSKDEMALPDAEYRTGESSWGTRATDDDDDRPTFENFLTKKASLADHLLWQLRLNHFTEEGRLIGTLIIGNLNEDGLLQVSLEEIASQSGYDLETVQKVIQKIQAFDPPGVAARDLKECLLIQAQQLYPQEPLLRKIIQDHLNLLAKKNYPALVRELGVSLEEVVRTTRLVSELDPRPGRRFSDENIPYITPDVFVFKLGDEYVVMLNEDGLPKLRINSYYRNVLREQTQSSGEAKEYINDKIR
jgi:RNA polymerase sigma-54 factor